MEEPGSFSGRQFSQATARSEASQRMSLAIFISDAAGVLTHRCHDEFIVCRKGGKLVCVRGKRLSGELGNFPGGPLGKLRMRIKTRTNCGSAYRKRPQAGNTIRKRSNLHPAWRRSGELANAKGRILEVSSSILTMFWN